MSEIRLKQAKQNAGEEAEIDRASLDAGYFSDTYWRVGKTLRQSVVLPDCRSPVMVTTGKLVARRRTCSATARSIMLHITQTYN